RARDPGRKKSKSRRGGGGGPDDAPAQGRPPVRPHRPCRHPVARSTRTPANGSRPYTGAWWADGWAAWYAVAWGARVLRPAFRKRACSPLAFTSLSRAAYNVAAGVRPAGLLQ